MLYIWETEQLTSAGFLYKFSNLLFSCYMSSFSNCFTSSPVVTCATTSITSSPMPAATLSHQQQQQQQQQGRPSKEVVVEGPLLMAVAMPGPPSIPGSGCRRLWREVCWRRGWNCKLCEICQGTVFVVCLEAF